MVFRHSGIEKTQKVRAGKNRDSHAAQGRLMSENSCECLGGHVFSLRR